MAKVKSLKQAKKLVKELTKGNKKHAAGWGAASGALASLAGDVATGVLSNFVEDTFAPLLKKGSKKKGRKHRHEAADEDGRNNLNDASDVGDVPAAVVAALCEHGSQTIPELLKHTRAKLVEVLRALRDLREFRLVEWVADDDQVRLTSTGTQTGEVLSGCSAAGSGRRK